MVKGFGVCPLSYWKMDIVDIFKLAGIELGGTQDTSLYTNDVRIMNGVSKSDLRNTLDG